MDMYTLPTILVYVFAIGGVALVMILIWSAQRAMTASKDRPKYKSQKVVKDYYETTDDGKKKEIPTSAVSTRLMERWREGLKDVDDF